MAPPQTTLDRPQRRLVPRAGRRCATWLAHYTDRNGLERQIVRLAGAHGSTLVIDRLAATLTDARLLAHLSAGEPAANAHIVGALYLADRRRPHCRRITRDDLTCAPEGEQTMSPANVEQASTRLAGANGVSYVLAAKANANGPPQLRWHRCAPDSCAKPVTVRQVIGELQSYEPTRSLSETAILVHGDCADISVAHLQAELERLQKSQIVLNRGLREAVLHVLKRGDVTLSEIAIRCGRIKNDERGKQSGETSWLARRVGMLPEGGHESPTPWVSSEVLALIAREGLGIAPRDVELA